MPKYGRTQVERAQSHMVKKKYASLMEIQEGNIVPEDKQLYIKNVQNPSKSEKRSDGFLFILKFCRKFCRIAPKALKNAPAKPCKCAYLLVIPGRFELPTYRLGGGCSILLSYGTEY